jgi:hypothetical protein
VSAAPVEPGPVTVGHITLTPKPGGRLEVECGICKEAMTAPQSFGGIPQDVLVKSYVETSHLHKPKAARSGRR